MLAMLLVGARILAACLGAAIGMTLARALGAAETAPYALAVAIAQVLVVLGDVGMTTSLARAVAEGRAPDPVVRRVMALRAGVALALAGSVAGAAALMEGPVSVMQLELVPGHLQMASVLLVVASLSGMCVGLLPALRRENALLAITVLQPALELAGIIVAWQVSPTVTSFIAASAVAAAASGAMGLAVILRGRPRQAVDATLPDATVRSVRAYGYPMFLVAICFTMFGQVDQLVIYALRGAGEAASYIWSWRLVALMHVPGLAVAAIVAPRMAGMSDRGTRALFSGWVRLLAVLYVGIAACTAAVAPWLVPVALGDGYGDAPMLLVMLSGYACLLGIAPLVTMAANYLGGARARVKLGAVTVCLNLALDVVLVSMLGAAGAAIATTIAFTWFVGGHALLSWRLLGGEVDVRRWLVRSITSPSSLVVGAVAASAVASSWGIATALDASGASALVSMLAGGIVGFGIYASGCLLGLRRMGLDLLAPTRTPAHEVVGEVESTLAQAAAAGSPMTEEGAA